MNIHEYQAKEIFARYGIPVPRGALAASPEAARAAAKQLGGEKFVVEPASIVRGSDHFVKSTMKTSSETIAFNYRLHQSGADWKVTDVLLAGNISQMAQKRSDFAATLAAHNENVAKFAASSCAKGN